MTTPLLKIAQESPTHLRGAASHMRKLASTVIELEERATAAEREVLNYKLAARMEQRGLQPDMDYAAKVAHVAKLPATKLAAFEEALELAPGGVGVFGRLTEDDKLAGRTGEDRKSEFDEWIMTGGPHS